MFKKLLYLLFIALFVIPIIKADDTVTYKVKNNLSSDQHFFIGSGLMVDGELGVGIFGGYNFGTPLSLRLNLDIKNDTKFFLDALYNFDDALSDLYTLAGVGVANNMNDLYLKLGIGYSIFLSSNISLDTEINYYVIFDKNINNYYVSKSFIRYVFN